MSKFHIIGITHEGKLDMLVNGDVQNNVLAEAVEFVGNYRQLFLVVDDFNVRELTYTPPVEGRWTGGVYSPLVLER